MVSDENLLKQIIGLYLKIIYKDVLLVILKKNKKLSENRWKNLLWNVFKSI